MSSVVSLLRSFKKAFNPKFNSVWRLTLGLSFIVTLMLLLMTILLYQLLIGEQKRQVINELTQQRDHFIAVANSSSESQFTEQFNLVADNQRILIIWQQGELIHGALNHFPAGVPLLPKTSEIPTYDPKRQSIRLLTAGQVNTRYGKLAFALPTEALSQLIQRFINLAAMIGGGLLLLTLLIGYLFASKQLKRLNQFNHDIRKVELGDLAVRLTYQPNGDEFDQLALSINNMVNTLQTNLETVRGITNNIAHDLRTPLTRVRLGLEQRLSQDESIGIEIEQLDNTIHTFDAMLALTKLESHHQPVVRQEISINDLIDDVVDMLSFSAEECGEQLNSEYTEISYLGDKRLLFQALFNLVDNAIKYCSQGDKIQLSVNYWSNREGIDLIVEDSGKGVESSHLDRLVERSYRVDSSRQQSGFGLGLPMVKAIAEHHGGKLEITSGVNSNKRLKGLKVVIKLPLVNRLN
ncbi:HAMP domain-containing histidine kinase [Vibrio sp. SS-MA-C1-2]|uniref:sensor histidine kinase n=1 Tax=Vibrio sp. SS-MA-C1-2 TaxID=2908646 RepID=UPI001F35BBD5|nr:HAMP domain-containing sensor histidine kinase [Vibrio sp. SS-MA-C1-2]UJF18201.1 HAMP domain-containing histidine kinase [Vibrio sp. SS-MA-C1-2]